MNICFYFYFNIAGDVVTVLLIFVDSTLYLSIYSHIFRDTHKHTCMISAQEEGQQPGTGAWLGVSEERFVLGTKAY